MSSEVQRQSFDTRSASEPNSCVCCERVGTFLPPRWGYAACSSCGVLRNDPFPSVDEIVQHYEQRSEGGNYDVGSISEFDGFRKSVFRDGLTRLLKHLPAGLAGKRVLDVGCFTGLSLEVIQENGGIPFGIELQSEAAQVAESKFPGRVYSCDICRRLPFDTKFTAVTLTDVLEHLHDPLAALQTLSAALEPGGHILFTTPNAASPLATVLGKHWPSRCPIHHIYLFNPTNVRRLLARAGFDMLQCTPLAKRYSLEYVGWVLPNLSPTLGKLFRLIPKAFHKLVLPMRGGEMLIVARKR